MMGKEELSIMIDAYAAAKVSGNKYLIKKMITEMDSALTYLFETPAQEGYLEPEEESNL